MDEFVATLVYPARDFLEEAKRFYQTCARKTELHPDDQLVVAYVNGELAGVVRLCFENETYVLRTMQIHPDFQRKGLGTILLHRFEDLLGEKKIATTYCLPYAHLEKFYSQIGFRKIAPDEAPLFLQKRLFGSRPDPVVILMKRQLL